jgi:hypothetical protein
LNDAEESTELRGHYLLEHAALWSSLPADSPDDRLELTVVIEPTRNA